MKKHLFLALIVTLFISGCSSDNGWKSEDYELVPFLKDNSTLVYVDTKTGEEKGYFTYAGLFREGVALVNDTNGYFYYVDKDAAPVNEERYIAATFFNDGLAWSVKKGAPIVAIDKSGDVAFEFKEAEMAYAFNDGAAVFVDENGKFGAVNKKGKIIVEPEWNNAFPMFVNGLLVVQNEEGLCGLINKDGEVLVECQFDYMGIDKKSQSEFMSNYVQALKENRIPFKKGGSWGITNSKGEYVINPQFDEIILDGDNYLFRKGKLWGWCDKEGHYIINPQFKLASPFGENKYTVAANDDFEYGYIDKEGKWVINPQFERTLPFSSCGLAIASDKSDDYGLIDEEGKWVVNPQFRYVYNYNLDNKFIAIDKATGSFGIIDKEGKWIVKPDYELMSPTFIDNEYGLEEFNYVNSDYVDVNELVKSIEESMLSLKTSTAGNLLTAYSIEEKNFPKYKGNAKLFDNSTVLLSTEIKATDVNAWNSEGSGWYRYNYTFAPETAVNSYSASFSLNNRAADYIDQIFNIIAEKYKFDVETETITVPNYEEVKVSKGRRSITFYIKTK